MDLYLSMTDSTKSQTVDSDLPYYCAFCLPGVLLTLGFENWAVLKPTFDVLCGDLQVGGILISGTYIVVNMSVCETK